MTDNIGNVRAVINSQRESEEVRLESFANYYSFGLPMPGQHANTQEYELDYQGQRKDAETGFNAFELRMFDARIGRWMAPDPYEQHWSPYLAMSNNPISSIDPDGGQNSDPQAISDAKAAEDLQRAHDMRVAALAKFHGDVNSEIYSDLSTRDREDIITMNPHMRDQLQNYYGSTAAAQDINRIFTLASLGGYKDKDGKTLHALNGKLGYYVDNYVFKEIRFPTLDPVTGITTIHDNSTYDNVPIFVPVSGGGGVSLATATLSFISVDISLPELTDAAWPKWVGYAIAGTLSAAYLYYVSEGNVNYPGPWSYTYQHPSQNPINNPPQGFDPNEPPPGWGGAVKWLIGGRLVYEMYDEYNNHINKLGPINAPRDNTNVVPKFVPYYPR